jgi:site-specific recombinase XerD
MSPWTLRNIDIYLVVIARALRLAKRPSELLSRAEIEAAAVRWVKRPSKRPLRAPRAARNRFTCYATRWLAFLGRLQPTPRTLPPYAEYVARFADHMRQERGLAARTIESHCRSLQWFLTKLTAAGIPLGSATVVQVDDVLLRLVQDDGYNRGTVQRMVSVLRVFFRYAEQRQWCRPGMAAAVVAPRVYRHAALPAGPSWADVERVIAAASGDKPAEIRARALLLLLAVYGLRRGEVAALRLEDFDWEREILTVPSGKRQRPRIYPLCRPVGDAVLRYLREARPPSTHREVFLRVRAPFHPMRRGSLTSVVRQRLLAAEVQSPHYGPHALRHTCATHLLMQGLSLKEIGDHLGHHSPEATRTYAKVDLTALRSVADVDLEGLR